MQKPYVQFEGEDLCAAHADDSEKQVYVLVFLLAVYYAYVFFLPQTQLDEDLVDVF
jgi:hypothetical protein